MKAFRETTNWSVPSGIYLLNRERLVAFRSPDGDITVFTRPLMFDRKGRTFQKVLDNELSLRGISGL